MSSDNLCKLLSEKYPERFALWLLGELPGSVEILKTELTIEPIRADYVTFLKLQERILHLEFQTRWQSEPPLDLRMLDYWVRLYRRYRVPITQVIVLLLPPTVETLIETVFSVETTRHAYRVVKLWEEDPGLFLNDPALLPLAPLTAASPAEDLLGRVADRVSQLDPGQRREIAAYTQILAGLKFNKELLQQLFREGVMRESVIYQDILEEGRQEGRKEGRQEGRQEGERALVLRLLSRRLGILPDTVQAQVGLLALEQLESLGEALLDFQTLADLETWLEQLPKQP